ncbi:uncharacterized protein LOC141852214 [Brevipalpus obovatus]|uniref:uncharacterized protein LOC141852214 n=1 Tax=Brevipalpus obovatus TaxID=246614 RepID=UPI003D9EFEBB
MMSFDRTDFKKLNLSLISCSLIILLSFLPLNSRSQLWTAGSGWNMPSPAPEPAPAPLPCPPCPPAPIKYIAIEIPKIVRVPGPPPPAPPALPAPPPPPSKKHQTIIPITIPLITSHEGQGWGH